MSSNPLTDVLPDLYRRYVYAVAFLVCLALAAWQAADGNWLQAVGFFAGSLVNATAASNTPKRRAR